MRGYFNWNESVGCGATGQAGFRNGYCTSDHVFVLKPLVDRTRAPGSPHKHLHSCFVDFRKAHDLLVVHCTLVETFC
jgi:hypothetical protein